VTMATFKSVYRRVSREKPQRSQREKGNAGVKRNRAA
jgi:hypothetical protein